MDNCTATRQRVAVYISSMPALSTTGFNFYLCISRRLNVSYANGKYPLGISKYILKGIMLKTRSSLIGPRHVSDMLVTFNVPYIATRLNVLFVYPFFARN